MLHVIVGIVAMVCILITNITLGTSCTSAWGSSKLLLLKL